MSILYEFEGKQLFKINYIPVPRFKVYTGKESIEEFAKELDSNVMMAKGQALSGGRGKAGLIKKVTKDEADDYIKSIIGRDHRGKPVETVLLEEPMEIQKEYYLAVMLDNESGKYLTLASSRGGVDIEEIAENYPDEIYRDTLAIDDEPLPYLFMNLGKKLGFSARTLTSFSNIMTNMINMAKKLDLTLVEINPLILTPQNQIIAADSKVVIDGNAYYRQENIASLKSQRDRYTDLEFEANEAGISYVQLDGEIGIISGGAGLSMATCDLLEFYGSSPANFLDVGGGADETKIEKSLEILSRQDVKGIFINFFAGITRCDDVAEGIINASKKFNIEAPIVIRLVGTNDKIGIRILEENGIKAYSEMEPAARKIVELVEGGN
ncbi:MAG: ADP-forming succinate--CoA ligase subunit beta [Candidatus Heimdallarchaeota archaeon]|nr:ADP-forming succinate--CoA ligase subunit beta [Candidatus Heimdallarchaeota archaeon]MCK4954372.1 ADP-forming succinate--CoA ligase subunit beta [Candidatus Heimdallarchaeota archaeon]